MSIGLRYKITCSNKLISMMSVILSLSINHSLVAISFSKSSTFLKSIISNTSTHKKSTFNSCNIPHIKLAVTYSAAHVSHCIFGQKYIHSIHSSYNKQMFWSITLGILTVHISLISLCAVAIYGICVKRINCFNAGCMMRGLIARCSN